jgi:hypothetical protein
MSQNNNSNSNYIPSPIRVGLIIDRDAAALHLFNTVTMIVSSVLCEFVRGKVEKFEAFNRSEIEEAQAEVKEAQDKEVHN